MEEILAEWESFARTLLPAAAKMESLALRDHAELMLEAIAKDIETSQSADQQSEKSKGFAPVFQGAATAATAHGVLRHTAGFDLPQLVGEFRALRAAVLRRWAAEHDVAATSNAYEITRFNEAIDQALAESLAAYSKELATSRDTFLAIFGHDLRNPLSALAGMFRHLSEPADEASRSGALAIGKASVSAIEGMIRDLLEYTRARLGGGIPIRPIEANLETVCKAAIKEASLVYPQTAFRFESQGRLDGNFDVARMHQVVSNLLNYAVQHGKRGFPVFLVALGTADVLTLTVTTQGNPIATEALQVIFEPLVQIPAEGSDQRRAINLGLGLFVAREIVRAHGGRIHATSSLDAGTAFTVELNRAARA